MVEWLAVPTLLALGWGGAAVALDLHGSRPPPSRTYDALVVAGCRVFPDGRPSAALVRRASFAADLYRRGFAPVVVLTGGPSLGAPISEARAAAGVCLAGGVPAAALVLEEESLSTLENARCAARLVQGEILVVSDPAHLFRARRMFLRHFARVDGAGAPPPRGSRARLALREVASVVRHAALGHL